MILIRDVFQAKYGKGGELVALFKEAREQWPAGYAQRILTDASGSFFTVVTETEVENLAAGEQLTAEVFALPEFLRYRTISVHCAQPARRDFYNIEG